VLPKQTTNSITIGLTQTKTSLGTLENGVRKIFWSNGDCIAANGSTSSEAILDAENSSVATFDFESELTYPLNILYPASFYKDASTITLPAVQAAATASFATNTLPMATSVASVGDAIKLSHLAGVIRLQLKAQKDRDNTIRKVEFAGNDGEQVSGDFLIDYNAVTLTPNGDKADDKKLATRVVGTLTTDAISDVFVVVPAQEYKNGFTVRIINSTGNYMDKKKSLDGKFNFSVTSNKLEDKQCLLTFSKTAWIKFTTLVQVYTTEIGWYGLVRRINEFSFYVYDILTYPLEVTGTKIH
jgi:hypothetical protein